MDEQHLTELWQQAVEFWESVENSDLRGDSTEFKDLLKKTQLTFQQIGNRVNEISLFSTNETIQDVQTSYMPFFLIPYYLALIEQKHMEDRRKHLNNAKVIIF